MNLKASTLVVSLFVLFSLTSTNAFNITKILSNASDFSSFNDLLTQTGLTAKINSRSTITVLALDGGDVGSLQGKPKDEVEKILSNHVILDYYDMKKLQNIPNKTATLTTLLQASGSARGGQGFLNVTEMASGDIMFGSAMKDATLSAKAVKSVFSEPYNISVIQISQAIVAPAIDATATAASSPESPQASDSPSPSPSPRRALAPPPSDDDYDDYDISDLPPLDNESESANSPTSTGDSGAPSALMGSRAAIGLLTVLALSFVGF